LDRYTEDGKVTRQKIEICVHFANQYTEFRIKISYLSFANFDEIGLGMTPPKFTRDMDDGGLR
jgi:hypothetical protein